MTVARATARCPYCRESIHPSATRCKHCHADLTSQKKTRSPLAGLNNFRTGFLTGVLFSIVLGILFYLQFFGGE